MRLKTGNSEDRRTFANVVTKLIPVEVKSDVGETLRVVINTYARGPDGNAVPDQGKVIELPLADAQLEAPSQK